jgi:hypothetical protein
MGSTTLLWSKEFVSYLTFIVGATVNPPLTHVALVSARVRCSGKPNTLDSFGPQLRWEELLISFPLFHRYRRDRLHDRVIVCKLPTRHEA